jgi:hypothetical protein
MDLVHQICASHVLSTSCLGVGLLHRCLGTVKAALRGLASVMRNIYAKKKDMADCSGGGCTMHQLRLDG